MQIAIKQVSTEKQESVKQLLDEADLMKKLLHPNIVEVYGEERRKYGNKTTVNMYMELVLEASMYQQVEKYGQIPETVMQCYLQQCLSAIQYCHERGVIHRDIKGRNILVNATGVIKLTDFGSAYIAEHPNILRPLEDRMRIFDVSHGTPSTNASHSKSRKTRQIQIAQHSRSKSYPRNSLVRSEGAATEEMPIDLKTVASTKTTFQYTPQWVAPEIVQTSPKFNSRCDIWSLGCVAIEMQGSQPWAEILRDNKCSVSALVYHIASSNDIPAIPQGLTKEAVDFIQCCLVRDPLQRPSAAELLRHPWFSNPRSIELRRSDTKFASSTLRHTSSIVPMSNGTLRHSISARPQGSREQDLRHVLICCGDENCEQDKVARHSLSMSVPNRGISLTGECDDGKHASVDLPSAFKNRVLCCRTPFENQKEEVEDAAKGPNSSACKIFRRLSGDLLETPCYDRKAGFGSTPKLAVSAPNFSLNGSKILSDTKRSPPGLARISATVIDNGLQLPMKQGKQSQTGQSPKATNVIDNEDFWKSQTTHFSENDSVFLQAEEVPSTPKAGAGEKEGERLRTRSRKTPAGLFEEGAMPEGDRRDCDPGDKDPPNILQDNDGPPGLDRQVSADGSQQAVIAGGETPARVCNSQVREFAWSFVGGIRTPSESRSPINAKDAKGAKGNDGRSSSGKTLSASTKTGKSSNVKIPDRRSLEEIKDDPAADNPGSPVPETGVNNRLHIQREDESKECKNPPKTVNETEDSSYSPSMPRSSRGPLPPILSIPEGRVQNFEESKFSTESSKEPTVAREHVSKNQKHYHQKHEKQNHTIVIGPQSPGNNTDSDKRPSTPLVQRLVGTNTDRSRTGMTAFQGVGDSSASIATVHSSPERPPPKRPAVKLNNGNLNSLYVKPRNSRTNKKKNSSNNEILIYRRNQSGLPPVSPEAKNILSPPKLHRSNHTEQKNITNTSNNYNIELQGALQQEYSLSNAIKTAKSIQSCRSGRSDICEMHSDDNASVHNA
eukprot:CAMPEP_0114529114 /NCGR_PEP_ID=MMETSP0109-20121206/24636_1 /TAXON_ID=29199 /ORGANISM="Chlorarachnion reptans, Strain CCCM449" /LENGTH=1006 /DNA_ID=CAMNT_0001711443 /DNA_START=426 /DNA_END=3443 /DNA_ORIENTATION=-